MDTAQFDGGKYYQTQAEQAEHDYLKIMSEKSKENGELYQTFSYFGDDPSLRREKRREHKEDGKELLMKMRLLRLLEKR